MSKIMFFGLKNWYIHRLVENVIAKHCELMDHDVTLVSYTKMFGGDDLSTGSRTEQVHKHIASKTGEHVNAMFQFKKVLRVEDFFDQQDLNNAENLIGNAKVKELKTLDYKGIKVGKNCRISTVRQSHCTDESDEKYEKFFVENVCTSIYVVDAFERLLVREKPDVVFVMNGIMFMERTLIDMCKKLGIRVISYERAARPGYWYITANEPINDFLFSNRFDIDKPLTDVERKEIEDYLTDRRTSKNTTQKFQDNDTDNLEKTKASINYEAIKDKTIVSLFTNVMWDTAAVDRDTIFNDVLDWCVSTIDWAKDQPDVELFVRLHPADSRYWNVKGAKQLGNEIKDYYSYAKKVSEDKDSVSIKTGYELPLNVHLIESNEKINSYCLAELSNVCSTYTSQIGGEIAAMGKPLVIAGDAFYGKQGIGLMPDSQAEYFYELSNAKNLREQFVADKKEEALRFEHFLYFKMHYPLTSVVEDCTKGMGVVTQLKFLKDIGNAQRVVDFDYIKNDKELNTIMNYCFEGIKDEFDVQEMEVKP